MLICWRMVAGIPLSKAKGSSTSVHVGCFGSDYEKVVSADPDAGFKYAATGVGTTMLADRISWFYDFKGPSITLNTACSSSLMAVHLACNSLKLGEASTVSDHPWQSGLPVSDAF